MFLEGCGQGRAWGCVGRAVRPCFLRAGAACAKWGVCGAAASCGMAFAILSGNAPLKKEGWGEGQCMVAQILAAIADAGAPRCCKRDSRIAVRVASSWFNDQLHAGLVESEPVRGCAVVSKIRHVWVVAARFSRRAKALYRVLGNATEAFSTGSTPEGPGAAGLVAASWTDAPGDYRASPARQRRSGCALPRPR